MNISFEGQVALVTGAGSGMGRATAKAFAESGAKVVLADIDEAAVKDVAVEIEKKGGKTIAVRCDVSDDGQVKSLIKETMATFGRLDAAYNNAAVQSLVTDTADLPMEEWNRIVSINLTSVFLCMKYELQQMRLQGSGAIVNASSLGGLLGNAGRAAYHAAKHGVLGLTKCAAIEYAARNIRINAICPGTIETPMVEKMYASGDLSREKAMGLQPIGRLGTAEEIAGTVLWLCSPAASLLIGQPIAVDGGYTIM